VAFDKKKFIGKFVEEARDHIGKLNHGVLALEKNAGDEETLNQIFRSAHTIKGSSRILSLKEISRVAHQLEDTLDALRGKKIQPSKELFNLLFQAIDMLETMTNLVQEDQEITIDFDELCEKLGLAAKGNLPDAKPADADAAESTDGESHSEADAKSADSNKPDDKESAAPADETAAARQTKSPKTGSPPQKPSKLKREETIRVQTDKLDENIKLTGEMVSNQSRMMQILFDLEEIQLLAKYHMETISKSIAHNGSNGLNGGHFDSAHRLHLKTKQISSNAKDILNIQSLLTDDLKEKTLKMRMLPLSTVLDAFPRLVRDISSSFGKEINFIVEGAETELDKKIIEQVGDPLLHMLRNSIDHGIESPDERVKAGKPRTGTLKISACYEGGSVLIELSDDGGGIPVARIKEKALQKKLFAENVLKNMSKSEIVNLIFRPGFSTSSIITDISGRGVGMDVVKDNIVEQLKGSIQVETTEGRETRFLIRLPLTLAVMRVLIFSVADNLFSVAVTSVREIVKIQKSQIIEVVNKKALRLREQIIPVVSLDRILQLPGSGENESEEAFVILVSLGSETLGLSVDSLVSEEDMEIKPLPHHMKKNDLVAGATLTGKNEILLLLHVPRIFELAQKVKEKTGEEPIQEENSQTKTILVVDDSINTREIEKSILESYGYTVDLASDGMEGFEKALQFQYDLIVTDIEMPRLDGFSLTEKLRRETAYRHTPIIIVSSRDKEADKRRGIQVGADAYIVKGSFEQSNLLNTVQSLID